MAALPLSQGEYTVKSALVASLGTEPPLLFKTELPTVP